MGDAGGRGGDAGEFVLPDSAVPGAVPPAPHEEPAPVHGAGLRRRRRTRSTPAPSAGPLTLRATDPVLRWGPVLLAGFAPLAWGSVDAWATAIVVVGSCAIAAVWILRLAFFPEACAAARAAGSHLGSWSGGVHRPLLALLAVGALSLLPLGPVVVALSPVASQLQHQAGIVDAGLTLSLARTETLRALAQLTALSLLFFAVLDGLPGRVEARRLTVALLALGFAHAVGGILWHYQSGGRALGAAGPYVNRNHFASLMGMTVPLGVGYLSSLGFRRRAAARGVGAATAAGGPPGRRRAPASELGAQRFLLGFAVAVMAGALALSLSRGGIVSTLVALAALAAALGVRQATRVNLWRAGAAIAAALAFAVWLAARPLLDRLATLLGLLESDAAAAPRTGIWADTLRMAADFPLFGAGFGTYAEVYPRYQTAHAEGRVFHAHNDWVQLLAEGGLAGTLAVLALVAVFAGAVAKLVGRRRDREAVFLALGGLAGLAAFLLHGFVEFNAHITANALWFTLTAALTLKSVSSAVEAGT